MRAFHPRGMNDQRDRGRRKKHHKSEIPRGGHISRDGDKWDVFENWLSEEFRDENGHAISPSASFDLKQFLQTCHPVDLGPDEKLRQLAIHWEKDCIYLDHPGGWLILKRIYDEAIRLDPKSTFNYHSLSLSARECAEICEISAGMPDQESKAWRLIMDHAQDACLRGLAIDPNEALLHLSLGRIWYDRSEPRLAIDSLQSALDADPKQMWAALYKAHCFHDLEEWEAAVDAYKQVDRSFFDGPNWTAPGSYSGTSIQARSASE